MKQNFDNHISWRTAIHVLILLIFMEIIPILFLICLSYLTGSDIPLFDTWGSIVREILIFSAVLALIESCYIFNHYRIQSDLFIVEERIFGIKALSFKVPISHIDKVEYHKNRIYLVVNNRKYKLMCINHRQELFDELSQRLPNNEIN